jgi:segregation and condensation protein A
VRAVLAIRASARWRDVVRVNAEAWEVLSALLALLELARRGELRLTQSRPFASVEIVRESPGEAA